MFKFIKRLLLSFFIGVTLLIGVYWLFGGAHFCLPGIKDTGKVPQLGCFTSSNNAEPQR